MQKTLVNILIVVSVVSALAIARHTAEMNEMVSGGDMSPACFTVCLTHNDTGAPAVALSFAVACIVLFIFSLEIFIGPIGPIGLIGQDQKDRHRYLMKTMVMLR